MDTLNLMRSFYLLSIFFIFNSCGTTSDPEYGNRDAQSFYINTQFSSYYLAGIPNWANFSTIGQCQRKTNLRPLDFVKINHSLGLSYNESIHLQHIVSILNQQASQTLNEDSLGPQEKELNFQTALGRVQSKLFVFKAPTYNKVHLIWIDFALSNPAALERFKKLMNGSIMDQGQPVVISHCLSQKELEKWLNMIGLSDRPIEMISAEMFNIYSSDLKNTYGLSLEIDKLFSPGQQLSLFIPKEKKRPDQFKGQFNLKTY